jgi:N-carbamoyl-L-amino-acid hydrolase
MSRDSAPLSIDVARFKSDLEALNAIGWTNDGGLARTAFSAGHLQAREWFMGRARAANMQTRIDSAANHSAVLPARDPGAPTLLIGSHLDSVPGGGRYDGALGVLCALEVQLGSHRRAFAGDPCLAAVRS